MELLDICDPADAVPAVFSHLSEVLHAVKVNWDIVALLGSSLLAGGEGLVDVIDTLNFFVVRAVVGCGDSIGEGDREEDQEDQEFLHM